MKMFAICVFAMLCLVHVSIVSSLITEHSCAYFKTAPKIPFDKNKYTGQWFMHQMNDFGNGTVNSTNYDCYVQFQASRDDGNHDLVEILVDTDQLQIQLDGLEIFDQPGIGHFTYSSKRRNFTAEWDILETDYVSFAIMWVCVNQAEGGSESLVFVRSRLPVILPTTQAEIDKVLDKHNIDKTKLRKTSLLSCPAKFLKKGGGGLLGGLVGGVVGLVGGVIGLVANLLGALLKPLLG